MSISPRIVPRFKKIQTLLNQLHPQADPQALVAPGSTPPQGDIIVLPGSFNPPTIAHLALLKQAQRFGQGQAQSLRDERGGQGRARFLRGQSFRVYAAFSKRTVDKEGVERPLLVDRVLLLQAVLRRRLPRVGILLFNRGLYVEQAEAIRAAFPRVRRIFFLMDFDKVVQIFDPRYYEDRDAALEELFGRAELLVVPRGGADDWGRGQAGSLGERVGVVCGQGQAQSLRELLEWPENRRFARFVHALPFDPLYRDVSSTLVRRGGAAYGRDVPQEVRQFMKKTRAYAPPVRSADGSMVDVYAARVAALSQLLHGPVS